MVYMLWFLLLTTVCSALHVPIHPKQAASDHRHHDSVDHHQQRTNIGKVSSSYHGKIPSNPIKTKREAKRRIDEKVDDINQNLKKVVDGLTDIFKDIIKAHSQQDNTNLKNEVSTSDNIESRNSFNPNSNHGQLNIPEQQNEVNSTKTVVKSQDSSKSNITSTLNVNGTSVSSNQSQVVSNSVINSSSKVPNVNITHHNIEPKPQDLSGLSKSVIDTKVANQLNSNNKAAEGENVDNDAAMHNNNDATDNVQHDKSGVVKRQILQPDLDAFKKHDKRHSDRLK